MLSLSRLGLVAARTRATGAGIAIQSSMFSPGSSGCSSSTSTTIGKIFISSTSSESKLSAKSQMYIDRERKHVAPNYAPIPVVISKGKGKKDV
jgi:hypothetical protein